MAVGVTRDSMAQQNEREKLIEINERHDVK